MAVTPQSAHSNLPPSVARTAAIHDAKHPLSVTCTLSRWISPEERDLLLNLGLKVPFEKGFVSGARVAVGELSPDADIEGLRGVRFIKQIALRSIGDPFKGMFLSASVIGDNLPPGRKIRE